MTRESMDVLARLGRIGRRRRLCLAAEAAGATGVAGCIVAATTAGAMGVQAGNRGVAMAMAAGPIVVGAVVAIWGRARRFARPGGAVAGVLIAGGVVGLAGVWGGPIDRVAL
ncbi:MAG: hypothetical protein NT031_19275, partial [Planctomycetota bacterium]|nr:hypothetical protein [Planctomycetota bacterium]